MCQNLADPPIDAGEVINYIKNVKNISKEKLVNTEKEESFEGRTRRRRSAVTS